MYVKCPEWWLIQTVSDQSYSIYYYFLQCSGVSENDPHELIASGIIGGEWGLRFLKVKPVPVSLPLLFTDAM